MNWLEEIIRGWYLLVRPDISPGDSTAWFASFWDFLKIYLDYHYGSDYCLSADCSLDLHVGNTVIPKQIIVMTKKGSGATQSLPHSTSLLTYTSEIPEEREEFRGLQIMTLAYAVCKISPTYFRTSFQEAEIALRSFHSTSPLFEIIVHKNLKSAAERIIGGYRHLGDSKKAEELKNSLSSVGFKVSEKNPFIHESSNGIHLFHSPYIERIHAMWGMFRLIVIAHFPKEPGHSSDPDKYLRQMAEKYTQDAYNSLSIEGYRVSEELITQVMKAEWSPDINYQDKLLRDALAARGYYEAHLLVKSSVEMILKGSVPGEVVKNDLPLWFQKLFLPSVQAGILEAKDLAGYRRHQVYIQRSRHVPPAKEHLLDLMEVLFQKLKEEPHAGVRAVLGHFIFVYIHPYMDGNGRIGRFLMNVMLASGGYPWTIIHVKNRDHYIKALEAASADEDILPFTKFIASELKSS